MPTFVLKKNAEGNWEGPKGAVVFIDVTSDRNVTKSNEAHYPDDAHKLSRENGHFKLAIEEGTLPVTVSIIPPADPDDWNIVEVGANGTTQVLDGFPRGDQDGSVDIQSS